MDRIETIRLLRTSHDEIITLRRRVAELEPRAHAYDTIAQVARLSIKREGQGYAPDVAWQLEKAVEELVEERDNAVPAAPDAGGVNG